MSFYGLLVRQCLIYSILSDNTGGTKMLKLETAKMQNAIQKAKATNPKVARVDDGEYSVIGSKGDKYIVQLGKANGLYLGECTCPSRTVCYHIAAACALHIGIKRGYSKESPAPRRGILVTNSHAGRIQTPVEVVGESKGRYQIRAITSVKLGGRNRWLMAGECEWVPNSSISIRQPLADVLLKQEGNALVLEGGMMV